MSEPAAAESETAAEPRPVRPVLRSILLDVAPPLVSYYGLRALGVSEYVALLTATVLAGAKVTYDAVKARRLDPFAGYLMLNFGLSLAVGLATSDARMLMAGNALVGGVGALVFLGSCLIGTPLTQIVTDRMRPADDPDRPQPGEDQFKHRVHIALSAMWGTGLLVSMGVSLTIIFTMSVDVAKAVDTMVSLTVTAALVVATFALGKRARAKWDNARPAGREQT